MEFIGPGRVLCGWAEYRNPRLSFFRNILLGLYVLLPSASSSVCPDLITYTPKRRALRARFRLSACAERRDAIRTRDGNT